MMLTLASGASVRAQAEDAAPAPVTRLPMEVLRFSGRWDLRAPDRAITVNSGSYVRTQFSGTGIGARFDLAANRAPVPTITWRIDDGAWQEAEIAPEVKLAEGLADGPHTLWLMVRGLDEHQSRWKQPLVASVTFTGLDLPGAGRLLPPPAEGDKPTLKMEFLGDSITEGVLVQGKRPGKETWPWQSDALHSYACQTAIILGADWRQVGFGATGLNHGGSGGAAPALASFNSFYDGCPRDAWQPDLVVINQGTNDGRLPAADYLPLYEKYLAMIRAAYPKAKIVALRPFNGAQEASIKQAVASAQAAGDRLIYYIDTTDWYKGPLHPPAKESLDLAARLVAVLQSQVLSTSF